MSAMIDVPAKKRGRNLSFDREVALKNAMLTFWKHGYETTSVSDLLAAMNISAPSLYTAFGDKQKLFFEAVDYYVKAGEKAFAANLDDAPTAKAALERLLEATVIGLVRRNSPRGCLLVTAAASGSDSSMDVQAHLSDRRDDTRKLIQARIERGIEEGDVPADTDSEGLAYFYVTVIHGMSIQARGGAKRKALAFIAKQAMFGWPGLKAVVD